MKKWIVFIMILVKMSCANAQTESSDTICYTVNQAKFLLSSTEKYYICDSLIKVYEKKSESLFEVIQTQGDQLQLSEEVLNIQSNEITKLQRQKKLLTFTLGTSIAGLFVFIFL